VAKASADQTVAAICQEAFRGAAVTMASVLAARRCVPDERPAFLARRHESFGRRGAASRSGPAYGRGRRHGGARGETLSGGRVA
jgi:hypothetical protein